MEKKQFRTTIKCSGCVEKVTPFLNEVLGAENWSVNTADPQKLLTVTSEKPLDDARVVEAVEKAGYRAEKMV